MHDKINLIIAGKTKKRKNLKNLFYDLMTHPFKGHIFDGKPFDMKKRKMRISAVLPAFLTVLTSCTAAHLEYPETESHPPVQSTLDIRILHNNTSKSSISPDEDLIKDICIMAYRQDDGRLAAVHYGEDAENIEMEMSSGVYNLYMTANMGRFDAPADEGDIGQAYHKLSSLSEMKDALPMCWKGSAELKTGERTIVNAGMSRLTAKIEFNIESGVLDGLEIISVRTCQGAGMIRPFMDGGSRIISEDEAVEGDYAAEEDLARLRMGEGICFFVTENCQGNLLPDNEDPWNKVPGNIGDKAGLCTYLEMKGRWNDDADYEGTVTYRFYLGEDAESNFDIKRNSLHNLTLYLKEESLDKISWKIDTSDMEPAYWEAYASLEENFHDEVNLYVTENIVVDFHFDSAGEKYWSRRNNGFTLAGIDSGGGTLIRFDKPTDRGHGYFRAKGTCLKEGSYDIVLIDQETGKIAYYLEYGCIRRPRIISSWSGIFRDEAVEGFDEESELIINDLSCDICLYLVDDEGYNLNRSDYYGCDLSICSWETDVLNKNQSYSLADCVSISSYPGYTGSDSYAVRYHLSVTNDGRDKSANMKLTGSLGRGMLRFTYKENTSGASGSHQMALYCGMSYITFKPVPDSHKSVLGTEFMYIVDNPSKLPLTVRGLKMNSMASTPSKDGIRPVLIDEVFGNRKPAPLLVSKMPDTICSFEEGAARSAVINGETCYAADDGGTDQSDIPDQTAMFHTFEVDFAYPCEEWSTDVTADIDLYDTDAHLERYGEDGYMNCGCIFHSGSGTEKKFDLNNGTVTDFRKYGDLLNREYIRKFNEIIEVDVSINGNNEITASASRDAVLDISVSGSLEGHIRCVTVQDPFFTIWGHYFTHSQEFSSAGSLSLSGSPVVIDGSALAEAFVKMREIPYYSLLDAWDVNDFREPYTMNATVREYLKPYGLSLNIDISSPEGIPVAVRFSGSARYDYKISAPATWGTGLLSSVTMVPSSYSGFDSRLDDDDCPEGALFKAEMVDLQPDVDFNSEQGLYHLVK